MMGKKVIIVVVAMVLLTAGVITLWRNRERGGAGTTDRWEEHWIRNRQKMALSLQNTLENERGQCGMDSERYERAIAILGNSTYDGEVVLYKCIVWHHNVYGPMLEIGFVDECASVAALKLRGGGQTEYPAFVFEHSGTSMQARKRMAGICRLRHPLRRGSDDSEVLREREKTEEPYYLRVPGDLYDSIVGGGGGVVLVDAEGEILDVCGISKVAAR
ncbi:MAG: hypothetical protein IH624_12865 [Phycisphaerae bacterium]|nr:hypothetical protein [Phycisphaerae bacterium]